MLTLIAFTSLASAADVTDMPSNLRGDISISFEHSQQWSGLVEASEPVGSVNESSNQLYFEGEFAVHDWVSIDFALPMWLGQEISWTDPRTMAWDPTGDVGSMRYGSVIEEGVEPRAGSGLGGASFGVRVSPISETRGAKASWVVGFSYQLMDDSNMFTGGPDDLGAGDGAGVTSITNAFSTSLGSSMPYIVLRWDNRGDHAASGIDPDTGEAGLVNMSSGSSASFVSGIELMSSSSANGQSWFKTDLWGGAEYHGWSEVPSGTYLPSVLSGQEGSTVVSSEYVAYTLGLGGHWRALPTMQVDMRVEFGTNSPIQLESAYPISTGTLSPKITAGIEATFFYR